MLAFAIKKAFGSVIFSFSVSITIPAIAAVSEHNIVFINPRIDVVELRAGEGNIMEQPDRARAVGECRTKCRKNDRGLAVKLGIFHAD